MADLFELLDSAHVGLILDQLDILEGFDRFEFRLLDADHLAPEIDKIRQRMRNDGRDA